MCFHLLSVTCYSDSQCGTGAIDTSDSAEGCCNSVDDGGLDALSYSVGEVCTRCPGIF